MIEETLLKRANLTFGAKDAVEKSASQKYDMVLPDQIEFIRHEIEKGVVSFLTVAITRSHGLPNRP